MVAFHGRGGEYDALLIAPHHGYEADGTPRDSGLTLESNAPIGMLSIAQFLHDNGLRVKLLHMDSERLFVEDNDLEWDLDAILAAHPAAWVGIQAHWHLYSNGAPQIAERYRRLHPDSLIYLGGIFGACFAEKFLATYPSLNGLVQGEGEVPALELTRAALAGKDHTTVAGAWHRTPQGTRYIEPADGSLVPMEELPIVNADAPPFDDVTWGYGAFINIARGLCPFQCGYCVANRQSFFRRPLSTVSVDRVIEQIRTYEKLGFKEIFLGESEFVYPRYVGQLAEALAASGLDITVRLETHPVLFKRPELVRNLVDGGFVRFTMGCESASKSVLKRTGRGSSREQILDAVRLISDMGGMVLTAWIANLPGETASEFRETYEAMREVVALGGQIYWIENLMVTPGTKFADDPSAYDIDVLVNTLEGWQRWSQLSKRYVTEEEFAAKPREYLTHINTNSTPADMVKRFYQLRYLARDLVPDMRRNVERNMTGNEYLYELEMGELGWFEEKGYLLLSY
ncbi:MAG: radical SAM protein [Myxococcales bacterium]|nr:radical SAM protein [Myxococcales bacterium]